MKNGIWNFMDIFRITSLLILTFLVAAFVANIAPWVLYIAVFGNFYIIGLEVLKYFLGIKELRSNRQKELVILER